MQAADSSERLGILILAILGSCFGFSPSPCTRNFLLHVDLFFRSNQWMISMVRVCWRKDGAGKSSFKTDLKFVQSKSVLGTFET
jgi:hypothetical protein